MKETIEFEVQQGWGDYKIVWLMKYQSGKPYNGYLEKGDLIWQEVTDGDHRDKYIPFMKIPGYGVDLSGLINALAKVSPPVEQKESQSELKATKYHLEDMRKLVLKEKYDK